MKLSWKSLKIIWFLTSLLSLQANHKVQSSSSGNIGAKGRSSDDALPLGLDWRDKRPPYLLFLQLRAADIPTQIQAMSICRLNLRKGRLGTATPVRRASLSVLYYIMIVKRSDRSLDNNPEFPVVFGDLIPLVRDCYNNFLWWPICIRLKELFSGS